MNSWKTTAAGIGAILGGLASIIAALTGGEGGSIEGGIAAILAGVGLLAARDNSKSSESVGAK